MQLNERSRWTEGLLFFAGFAACVPAANWLIENVERHLRSERAMPDPRRAAC